MRMGTVIEKGLNRDKRTEIGYAAFLLLLLVLLLYCSNSGSLWVDEIFSLELVDLPWGEMLSRASDDVHPPLYYIMLKAFLGVTQKLGLGNASAGKIFSVIPFFLTILLAGKKMAGKGRYAAALLFAVCLTVMPNMLNYAIEIRGYSWAMFFVTAAYIYAGEVLRDGGVRKNWYFLLIFGVFAAYTHYFACIAVAVIYLGMLIYHGNNRKFLKKWLVSVLVSCVLFLPWLLVFVRQLGKVMDEYWIGPITLQSLYEYFRFLFEPPMEMFHIDIILGIALAMTYVSLFFCTMCERREGKARWLLWGCMVLFLTGTVGVVVSLLARPIFVARYMVTALGCFWLAYAGMMLENRSGRKRFVSVAAALIVLAAGFIDTVQFVRWETIRKGYYEEFQGVLADINENALVSTDGEHIQGCLIYYLGRQNVERISADSVRKIADNTESNTEFWYFCSKENLEDMQLPEHRKTEQLGEYHLEYYSFYVFRIT